MWKCGDLKRIDSDLRIGNVGVFICWSGSGVLFGKIICVRVIFGIICFMIMYVVGFIVGERMVFWGGLIVNVEFVLLVVFGMNGI